LLNQLATAVLHVQVLRLGDCVVVGEDDQGCGSIGPTKAAVGSGDHRYRYCIDLGKKMNICPAGIDCYRACI
jgi:hypothetical protein